MSLQDRINSLKPYLLSVDFGDIPTANIALPEGWGKIGDQYIKLGLLSESNGKGMICAVYSEHETTTIDDILDYIKELIKMNLEREEKSELFYSKVEELKTLFDENSLEDIKTLVFTLHGVKYEVLTSDTEKDGIECNDMNIAQNQTATLTEVNAVEADSIVEPKMDSLQRRIAVICSDYDDFIDWKHNEGWGEYDGTKKQFKVGNTTYIAVKHPNDAKGLTIAGILATDKSDNNPLKPLIHSHLSMQQRDELED